MKIHVEIDAKPEELRRFLGLPDVSELQEELLAKIREKMLAGVDGFDPITLMKPYLPENLQSLQALQKQFWENMLGATKDKEDKKSDKSKE